MTRLLLFVPVAILCLAAVPAVPRVITDYASPIPEGRAVAADEFSCLATTDAVAALEASLAWGRREVRGYTCMLHKQETLNGRLGGVEIIRHAVRHEPFAVFMAWVQGGAAKATLYVRGENGGRMKVRTFVTLDADPNGFLARSSSRYSIEDAGILNATLRTWRAWKALRDAGRLHVEYLGRQHVPELDNRECYVIRRRCDPLEVDNFRLSETEVRDPAKHPKEAFAAVTIYLDCESRLQIGSKLDRADGTLHAAYYFRDLKLNPAFEAGQFTPAALQ